MHTEAVENYLKTIYEIQQQGRRVKTTTLAQTLGVTAGSVTDRIKRMSNIRPKLVSHELPKGVSLTPCGKKVALGVIRSDHFSLESGLFTRRKDFICREHSSTRSHSGLVCDC
jgi:Mn-dependent DtxR family transcriptional regulator